MPFRADVFVTNYVGIPIFFVLWLGYKMAYHTRVIPASEVDLVTGLRAIDEEEQQYLVCEAAKGPQGTLRKMWESL